MNRIEKTAFIDSAVELGDNNYIGHYAVIKKGTIIGNNNFIGSHTVIGELCQHSVKKHEINGFSEEESHKREVIIGSNNVIREFTTVHMPTSTAFTKIADHCYIMAYNHISHDTIIHDNVILSNNTQIGGHTNILPYANIGLSSIIHQRSTIGSFSMVGMGSIINKDIPPFLTAYGTPIKSANKINEWGLKRYGHENAIQGIIRHYAQNAAADLTDYVKQQLELFNKLSKRAHIEILLEE